jgi:hypothetical protein
VRRMATRPSGAAPAIAASSSAHAPAASTSTAASNGPARVSTGQGGVAVVIALTSASATTFPPRARKPLR